MAVERELDRSPETLRLANLVYDDSGYFLLYATPMGVKVVNVRSNKCVRLIGNEFFLFLSITECM